MSNLDAIRALQASQTEAAAPKAGQHEPLDGWKVELTAADDAPRRRASKGSGQGDADVKAMLAEVDLLSVIQADTGEQGHKSGERIDFHECPVCHHRACFSYYPSTNSWSCFGASNSTGYDGGSALEYYKATRTDDDTEAVKWLRGETGHPYEPKPKDGHTDGHSAQDGERGGYDDGFPPITQSKAIEPPRRAPVLIEGILRKGHTLLVTARSKAGKTFLMLGLAVAVACRLEWLGRQCEQGRVLFVNPEVDPPSAENRLHDVAEAMGADLARVRANVDFWHLRGHAQGINDTARALFARASRGAYTLIIFDSVYELYTGDENSADDAREFFHGVDRISKQLDCAVAMTHHHAKGIRADLDSLDRGSGSGVFGRKPDAPLDLIQVFPPSEDDALEPGVTAWRVSDSGLREFPALEPFDVFFKYPRHILVADNSTADWKPRSSQQNGGRKTGEKNKQKSASRASRCELAIASEFIARGIGLEGISASEAAEVAGELIGETVKTATLKGYIETSELFDVEQTSPQRWRVVPKRTTEEPPPSSD